VDNSGIHAATYGVKWDELCFFTQYMKDNFYMILRYDYFSDSYCNRSRYTFRNNGSLSELFELVGACPQFGFNSPLTYLKPIITVVASNAFTQKSRLYDEASRYVTCKAPLAPSYLYIKHDDISFAQLNVKCTSDTQLYYQFIADGVSYGDATLWGNLFSASVWGYSDGDSATYSFDDVSLEYGAISLNPIPIEVSYEDFSRLNGTYAFSNPSFQLNPFSEYDNLPELDVFDISDYLSKCVTCSTTILSINGFNNFEITYVFPAMRIAFKDYLFEGLTFDELLASSKVMLYPIPYGDFSIGIFNSGVSVYDTHIFTYEFIQSAHDVALIDSYISHESIRSQTNGYIPKFFQKFVRVFERNTSFDFKFCYYPIAQIKRASITVARLDGDTSVVSISNC